MNHQPMTDILKNVERDMKRELAIDAEIHERSEHPIAQANDLNDYHRRHIDLLKAKIERVQASVTVDCNTIREKAKADARDCQDRITALTKHLTAERNREKQIIESSQIEIGTVQREAEAKIAAYEAQVKQSEAYLAAGAKAVSDL